MKTFIDRLMGLLEKSILVKKFIDRLMGLLNGSIIGLFLGLSTAALINVFTSPELNSNHYYAMVFYIIAILCLSFMLLIQEKTNRLFITKSESNKTASIKTNLFNARTDNARIFCCFIGLSIIFILSFPISLYFTNSGNQENRKEEAVKGVNIIAKIDDTKNQVILIMGQLDLLNRTNRNQVLKLDSVASKILHGR
jgi:hypothetical protein